jgi:hypothetical protein
MENEKSQNSVKVSKNTGKNMKKTQKLSKNSKYFDFYDDVKAGCQKRVDW